MFYGIFKREFLENWGLCCSMGPNFFRKFGQKFERSSKVFKKINVLRFEMVSNRKILKTLNEITH